jgi:hypothetical protein
MSILFREAVTIRTSDSDQDDFIRNRLTILCECRVTNPVWSRSAFCIAVLA